MTKFTSDELKNVKLKEITSAIGSKMTTSEKDRLKEFTSSDERRAYLIEMYNKYIDLVISESNESAKVEAVETAKTEEKTVVEETKAKSVEEVEIKTKKVYSNTDAGDINTAVSFSVTIRGITGYNGTVTVTCENLLLLVLRNPRANIQFRTSARANQFINILKNVKHVKGIFEIDPSLREQVIAKIKSDNNI